MLFRCLSKSAHHYQSHQLSNSITQGPYYYQKNLKPYLFKSHMNKCPIDNCGRTFESLFVMQEHLKRRHPKYQAESLPDYPKEKTNQDQVMQEQINLLPKIKQLKMQSREHKPVEVYRKSLSKGKPDPKTIINPAKMSSVISDSRTYLETAENNERKGRRPSLKKTNNQDQPLPKQQKLPELKTVRQKKLQILTGQQKIGKTSSFEDKDPMYATAPDFNKGRKSVQERSRSKQKTNLSYFQEESSGKEEVTDRILLVKTQQGFHEKEGGKPHHRPLIKRPIEKEKKAHKPEEIEEKPAQEKRQQIEVAATSQTKKTIELKRQFKPKTHLRRESSPKKQQLKPSIPEDVNFDQRIAVVKSVNSTRLTVPPTAKCQFIYANNCNLLSVNLNDLETLRELSLQHNNLKDLSFLNYSHNHNIEKLYLDHNRITALDYLPPNLKVLSVTFNDIAGLQNNTRELSSLSALQQIDFTFNPIRKEPNYKFHVISSCLTLKKIDGIKITKFDLQMASEYSRMLDEQLGLIPSNKFQNLVVSKCSPSTTISAQNQPEPEETGLTFEQLEKEINKLSKITKQTQDNLSIIKQENQIITQELNELKEREEQVAFGGAALYEKLVAECEALELLNFLQYASEEQLEAIILKKQQEMMA